MTVNRRSVTILSSTGTTMDTFSTETKADSYFGYTDGLHTIQVTFVEFEGRIRLQGTLSLEPTANDWFDINPGIVHGTAFVTNADGTYNEHSNTSGSEAYTFTGNYAFVRLHMDRANVGDGANYIASYGEVNRALLSS